MTSSAASVPEYLAQLPPDRREALEAVRAALAAAVPDDVEEGMQYGMPGWFVPHRRYPRGYHCDPRQPLPYLHLASQKQHMAVYLFCAYVDADATAWIQGEAARRGVKLDMGKSCVRFKRLSELPLDLIVEAVRRAPTAEFIARYEAGVPDSVKKKWK